jgi:hypothetical protein
MPATAEFIKLPKTAIEGLSKVAAPKKRLIGPSLDRYYDYLQKHGQTAAEYRWTGYVLATVLPYLKEKHQIDLMKSEYDILGSSLTKARESPQFVLTNEMRKKYLDKLDALSVSEDELRDYYNEFNATNEPDAGKPMLDGVKAFSEALSKVDESSVILFMIG